MTIADERLFFEHLGEDALCYVLNVDPDRLRLRFEDGAAHPLSGLQEIVIELLVTLDKEMKGWQHGESTADEWAARLATYPDDKTGISLGNLAHQMAGGTLATIPEQLSPVEKNLLNIALDNYPGLVVRGPGELPGQRTRLPAARDRQAHLEAFGELAAQDADLNKLCGPQPQKPAQGRQAAKRAGGQQLQDLAEAIVMAGWTLALLYTPQPTPQIFTNGVLGALNILRRALQGKHVTVPVRIELAGVVLPEGMAEVDFGWARIRQVDARSVYLMGAQRPQGRLVVAGQSGAAADMASSGALVIDLDVPLTAMPDDAAHSGSWAERLNLDVGSLEQTINNLQLGLLLAMPDKQVVPRVRWHTMVAPFFSYSGIDYNSTGQTPAAGGSPLGLTKSLVAAWQSWADKIFQHQTPAARMAIGSLLAALIESRTPEKALVQAVAVWESLCGSRGGGIPEVTSSLAQLLSHNPTEQKAQQAAYQHLYDFRNRVVRGDTAIDEPAVQEQAAAAARISIGALRVIFAEHPEWLDGPGEASVQADQ